MRLVGASNFSIQLPFILEGAFAAAIGALLSVVAILALTEFVVTGLLAATLPFTSLVGSADAWAVAPALLAIGAVLAVMSSALTLRRFLSS